MATLTLLPFDPCAALLQSAAILIREGIADCDLITDPDNVAWTEGEASPDEHFLVPEAGWHLYVDRDPEEVDTPCIALTCPEEAKEKSAGMNGIWNVMLQVEILIDRDQDIPAMERVVDRLQILLTSPVVMNDTTVQLAQERLSTASLHVHGSRRDENFEGTATGKLDSQEGHPHRLLAIGITCSLIA